LWVCVIARHPDPRERERELALKEEELQMTRKLKEAELVLQKQQIKNKQELENTLAMKTKRFSDVLKGALIKMSSDPVEVASFFGQIDDLHRKFEVPENAWYSCDNRISMIKLNLLWRSWILVWLMIRPTNH